MKRTVRNSLVAAAAVAASLVSLGAWATHRSVWRAEHRTFEAPAPLAAESWDDLFARSQKVKLCTLQTGSVAVPRSSMLRHDHDSFDAATENVPFAIYAHLIRHPSRGDVLVDAGLDASFERDALGNFRAPARFIHTLMKASFTLGEGEDLASRLGVHDTHPSIVFVTHVHGDHTAGIASLPGARVVVGAGEREDVAAHVGYGHIASNQVVEELPRGLPRAPFDSVVDVFGDGSFLAIATPGHSKGHTSYLAMTADGPVLLAGDASHSAWAFEHDIGPVGPSAADEAVGQKSLDALRTFVAAHPSIKIVFGHEAVTSTCAL